MPHPADILSMRRLLLALGLSLTTTAALALPTDRDQQIVVSADHASFNEQSGIATYTGNILIQQGSLKIRADKLLLTTDSKGTVLSAVASGAPAHFEMQPAANKGVASAEAQEVTYQAREGIVSLKGQAKLQQDGSSFRSAEIRYNMEQGEIEAHGDSQNRVQLTFPPPAKENRSSKRLGDPQS